MKSTRLKPQPLQNRAEFTENVRALLALEAQKRKINAERDAELIAVNKRYDDRLTPILADIKGRLSLVEDYADDHRSELLPKKDAKSFTVGLARTGWRSGNRTVGFRSGVTAEQAVNALEALHLEPYVRVKKEVARDLILADCKDDKTLTRPKRDAEGVIQTDGDGQPIIEEVPLADAGLKISQGESFFVEPISDSAETLTPASANAAA